MKILLITAGVFLSPQVLASTATLTEWGTIASVASGSCPDNSCTPADVLSSGITVAPIYNGYHEISSTTGPVTIAQGSAQSRSEIKGELATPTLKVKASATVDSWIAAGAYAIQGYEYTGAGENISFDINFDGNLTNLDSDTATGFAGGMYLFSTQQMLATQQVSATFLSVPSFFSDPALFSAVLDLGSSFLGDNQVFEFEAHSGDASTGAVNESGQININLIDGDQFYLVSAVLASAGGNGAIADAYSTFSAEVDPSFAGQLDPVGVSAVPVPAAVWFFISGLLGLIGIKRTSCLR